MYWLAMPTLDGQLTRLARDNKKRPSYYRLIHFKKRPSDDEIDMIFAEPAVTSTWETGVGDRDRCYYDLWLGTELNLHEQLNIYHG